MATQLAFRGHLLSDPKVPMFTGTQAQWEALTVEQRREYDVVVLTDDMNNSGFLLTNSVEEGNYNAITSDGVYQALDQANLVLPETTSLVEDGNQKIITSDGVYHELYDKDEWYDCAIAVSTFNPTNVVAKYNPKRGLIIFDGYFTSTSATDKWMSPTLFYLTCSAFPDGTQCYMGGGSITSDNYCPIFSYRLQYDSYSKRFAVNGIWTDNNNSAGEHSNMGNATYIYLSPAILLPSGR